CHSPSGSRPTRAAERPTVERMITCSPVAFNDIKHLARSMPADDLEAQDVVPPRCATLVHIPIHAQGRASDSNLSIYRFICMLAPSIYRFICMLAPSVYLHARASADRERRLFHQFDDLELLGCGIPHEASSPSPRTLFLSRRFSIKTSASVSLSWRASALSSLTSSEVASRAVSPASRFLPACRNSFDQR